MTRLVLSLDTATEAVAVGVGMRGADEMSVLRSAGLRVPRKANSLLLTQVDEQLQSVGVDVQDVREVVVGRGPGSFTGVRIGVSTAKGIAQGLGVPLFGVCTLDAIAWNFVDDEALATGAVLAVVGDAMRGEVYPALFRLALGGLQRLSDDTVCKPQEAAESWARELRGPVVLAGNGLAKHAEVFLDALGERAHLSDESLWAPTGGGLLQAYTQCRRGGRAGDGRAATVLPIYTRLSDAEENERASKESSEVPASGVRGVSEDEVTIRPMSADDILEVLEIERNAFSDPWSEGIFAEELSAPRRAWFVAEDASGIVGYAGVAVLADDAHVMNLAVRQDRRHRGTGRRLLGCMREMATELGARLLTLEVRENNHAARELYESEGLELAGARPRYYSDTGEDALIMWSRLPVEEFGDRSRAASSRCKTDGESLILSIETSCDETAAAVLKGERDILGNVVASQIDFHARFGGVVPEIASRKHTEAIVGVVDEAMRRSGEALECVGPLPFAELDAIAVTHGPGLVGALVVGLAYAKGLSYATNVPLVGVNHLEGHIFANILADPEIGPPLVALIVSGGHTSLIHMPTWGEYHTLGETLDDAAGEAFDKVAKFLELGYPGGPVLSRLAEEGNAAAIDFPRAMMRSGDYSFSLSGLKTAVITYIRHEREAGREIDIPDLAASFQAAIVDVQVAKAVRAVEETGVTSFCLAGGVAANPALREALRAALEPRGVRVGVPPLDLCTDNAAMIAVAARYRYERGERLSLDAEAIPGLRLDSSPS